jgi:hypothetical protein
MCRWCTFDVVSVKTTTDSSAAKVSIMFSLRASGSFTPTSNNFFFCSLVPNRSILGYLIVWKWLRIFLRKRLRSHSRKLRRCFIQRLFKRALICTGPFEQLKCRSPFYFSVIFNTNHLVQIGIVERINTFLTDSLSITNINFALWSVSRWQLRNLTIEGFRKCWIVIQCRTRTAINTTGF